MKISQIEKKFLLTKQENPEEVKNNASVLFEA